MLPQRYFDPQATPKSLFDVPLSDIQEASVLHAITRGYTDCPWMRCTSSLEHQVRRGLEVTNSLNHTAEEAVIAVIDTERLGSYNTTVHESNYCSIVLDGAWTLTGEMGQFFVYGFVPAEAYTIVSLAMLMCEFTPDVAWKTPLHPIDMCTERLPQGAQNLEVDLAKEFAKPFGDDLSLFVACLAITLLPHESAEVHEKWMYDDYGPKLVAAQAFSSFPIPEDWYKDSKLMYDCEPLPPPSVCRGISLLRLVMKNKQRPSSLGLQWFHDINSPEDDSMSMRDVSTEIARIGFLQFREGSVDSADSTSTYHPTTATIADTYMSEGIEENESVQLPSGIMHDGTKQILLDAQKRTPRYLFRGWRNGVSPSGGYEGLNSPEAIVPLAYLGKPRKSSTGFLAKTISYFTKATPPEDIFHLTHQELHNMTCAHLQGTHHPKTEFSSWAASLQVAFRYARNTGFISIIDTKELEHQNVIIHVPSLRPIIGGMASFPEEYLAHGVISGRAHKAIPVSAFLKAGCTIDHFQTLGGLGYTSHRTFSISDQDLANAKQVATQYGASFAAPIMIAVLTLKQRDAHYWRDGFKDVHLQVNAAMKEFAVPKKLCADATVLTDIVHCNGFGEVEQMLRLLRAIVELRHGKGARTLEKAVGWAQDEHRDLS